MDKQEAPTLEDINATDEEIQAAYSYYVVNKICPTADEIVECILDFRNKD